MLRIKSLKVTRLWKKVVEFYMSVGRKEKTRCNR